MHASSYASFFFSFEFMLSALSNRSGMQKSRESHTFVLVWPQSQLAFSAFRLYAGLVIPVEVFRGVH